MSERELRVRQQWLPHAPDVSIDRSLLEKRFAEGCDTANCRASCCAGGVWVDLSERDRILAHADAVAQAMDSSQNGNPADWFDADAPPDADFPSGRAVGTQVFNGRCVFLDGSRRCTLHALALKPFFCRIFPLTMEGGTLMLDDALAAGQSQCCGPTPDGPLTIFDVCREEFEDVLGADGAADLARRWAEAGS